MNLAASAIVLRPRSFAEVLDLACRISMSLAFSLYARLSLLVLLPVYVGGLVLRYAAGCHWALVWVFVALLGSVAQGVFTIAIGRLLFAEALGARQVLRLFGRRALAYAGSLVLTRAMLFIAALPALFGVPFLWPRVFFMHEACLLEGANPIETIQRSMRFVSGRATVVLGVICALLLTQVAFVGTVELLFQALIADVLQLGKPFGSLFSDGGSPFALAGLLISFPYVATARFLHYIDARTRSDGWDIQLRFMAIAVADADRKAAA